MEKRNETKRIRSKTFRTWHIHSNHPGVSAITSGPSIFRQLDLVTDLTLIYAIYWVDERVVRGEKKGKILPKPMPGPKRGSTRESAGETSAKRSLQTLQNSFCLPWGLNADERWKRLWMVGSKPPVTHEDLAGTQKS
ncbi:hypothetical protein ZHAS_00008848 [Anopheles sinensis]|uniref:Uncharacterized protein n=1 Tax=Anopheles sinensis TaxID=74873 RepID=A0A084VTG4_ANOSI|nr:hypothetical protein ZHAS_00008848 [Anopheles sinensis]